MEGRTEGENELVLLSVEEKQIGEHRHYGKRARKSYLVR